MGRGLNYLVYWGNGDVLIGDRVTPSTITEPQTYFLDPRLIRGIRVVLWSSWPLHLGRESLVEKRRRLDFFPVPFLLFS